MSTPIALLVTTAVLIAIAVAVLVYLASTQKGFSFHGLWDRALAGDRASRLYLVLVLLACALAFTAFVMLLAEKKAARRQGALPPQPTAPTVATASDARGALGQPSRRPPRRSADSRRAA